LEGGAEGGGGGFEAFVGGEDFDGFGAVAGLEEEVDGLFLVEVEGEVGGGAAEAGGVDGDFVVAGGEEGEGESAGGVGLGVPGAAGGGVGEGEIGVADDGFGAVADGDGEEAAEGLGLESLVGEEGEQEKEQDREANHRYRILDRHASSLLFLHFGMFVGCGLASAFGT